MRIVHLADVHLDRPFVGLSAPAATARRLDLFDAFMRCLELAQDRQADLVTIGGDLWEEEHVRADTRNSVAHELGQLGRDVLLICGNHDPLVPGGSYRRTTWPSNVQIAPRRRLEEYVFGNTSVWAVSWGGGDLPPGIIERADVAGDGRVHLLLLHGSSTGVCFADDHEYFPFSPASVAAAGFDRCLAGHLHEASDVGGVVYPGSPEPLGWAERGRHCAAVLDVVNSDTHVELVDVNDKRYEAREVNCAGCGSSSELDGRLAEALLDPDPESVFLRVRLVGEIDPDCIINEEAMTQRVGGRYAGLVVVDSTEPVLEVDARAARKGLDGVFVGLMRERIEQAKSEDERHTAELALQAGLRALDRRDVILRVD